MKRSALFALSLLAFSNVALAQAVYAQAGQAAVSGYRPKLFHKLHKHHAPAEVSGPRVSGSPGSTVTPTVAPIQCQSVVQVATAAGSFNTLLAAAQAAGLAPALSDTNLVATVFAPTDAAFAKLLAQLGVDAPTLLANKELLSAVLQYHVVPGVAARAEDLVPGQTLDTLLAGQDLEVLKLQVFGWASGAHGEKVAIRHAGGDSNVIKADVPACKSVIHVVDQVFVPKGLPAAAPAAKPTLKEQLKPY